jgi:hypothetical protein
MSPGSAQTFRRVVSSGAAFDRYRGSPARSGKASVWNVGTLDVARSTDDSWPRLAVESLKAPLSTGARSPVAISSRSRGHIVRIW